jgi:tRNA threonylcarbamoyladenosine biosynthesis protein TsaB
MNLLAIDTARSEGGVALLRHGSLAGFASLGAGPGFGEVLFGAIERLLADHAVELDDLDGFAAATGPGWFTGIRVGLVAAKAMAEVHDKPLVGVSSLRALASSAAAAAPRASLLDARRGEVFAGFYDHAARPLLPEAIGRWEDLAPRIGDLGLLLVANEPSLFEAGGPVAAGSCLPRRMGPAVLAREIALLAARDIEAGQGSLPEAVEANYIRRPGAVPPGVVQAARR